jgi:tyrosine-protein kinase Etk/Wzc
MTPKNDSVDLSAVLGPAAFQQEEEGSGLADYLSALADSKWLIMLVTLLAALFGLWEAFTQTPSYRTQALVQVEVKQTAIDALRPTSALFETYTPLIAETYTLRSRAVIGDVVDALDLTVRARPVYYPRIGEHIARRQPKTRLAEPWFGKQEYAWGGEIIRIGSFNVPRNFEGRAFTLIAGEPGSYRLLDGSGELLLAGRVEEQAKAELADGGELVLFVSELRARPGTRFTVMRQTRLTAIERLRGRLQLNQVDSSHGYSGLLNIGLVWPDPVEAAKIVNEIANIYVRLSVERKSAQADQSLTFLEGQLPVLKEQLEAAERALNNYEMKQGSVDLSRETNQVLSRIVELETEAFKLEQERQQLLQNYTLAHPNIKDLDARIAFLQDELSTLDKSVKKMPVKQQKALSLERDVQLNMSLYTALLNSAQQLRVAKAGTVGNVRIIDYALPNWGVLGKDRGNILLTWVLAGLFIGIVLALVRRFLFSGGIEDPDLLEKKIGLPVYATIPHSSQQIKLAKQLRKSKRSILLAQGYPGDASIESMRSLRTTLHFALMDTAGHTILITGPSPGVGKSFVTVNLSAVLASTGRRVLVIDADLRKGLVNHYLGVDRTPGLTDFINSTSELADIVRSTTMEGLDFIATGTIPPNPSELLLHERFNLCLETLSPRYDYVLIDTAPVLAVTDAAIVGRLADAVLMVCKSGAHPLREIEHSVKRLRQAGVSLKGLLLNDVEIPKRGYGYGNYYRYKYQYRYGYKYGYQYTYKK